MVLGLILDIVVVGMVPNCKYRSKFVAQLMGIIINLHTPMGTAVAIFSESQ